MTTSTPPAWHFLHECDVPVETQEVSFRSQKLPIADVLREQNDSPGCNISCSPNVSCGRKHDAQGCDEAAQVTNAQSCAVPEHVKSYVSEHPSWVCNDCGQDRYGKPNGMSTWHYDYCRFCGEFVPCTEPRDFGNRHDSGQFPGQKTGSEEGTHQREQGKDADSFVVTSCPDCGAATDIDYGTVKDKPPDCQGCEPEPARSAIGAGPLFDDGVHSAHETPTNLPVGARSEYPEPELLTSTANSPRDVVTVRDDNLSVPFSAQEWMFESLCEVEIENLHDLIDDHHDLIIEMARDRFRAGYAKYGSTMYSWSPERRLDETLQEVADSVVYLTSGSTGR